MLVVCTNRILKKPIEFDLTEEQLNHIKQLPSQEAQNSAIAKLALDHIKKYGYDLGRCKKRSKNIDYKSCLECGIELRLKKGEWESCKRENITYKYPTSHESVMKSMKTIKDPKIRSALELSPQEMKIANQLYLREK